MSQPPVAASRSLRLSRTLTFDLITSYAATFARAGSMLAIVSLLAHRTTAGYLAAFLFLRAMLGFLNNVFVGAGPAAIAALRLDSVVVASEPNLAIKDDGGDARPPTGGPVRLDYQSRDNAANELDAITSGWGALFIASVAPAVLAFLAIAACVPQLVIAAGPLLPTWRTPAIEAFTALFSMGLLARLASDAAGGALQGRRFLWLDNLLVVLGEVIWFLNVLTFTTTNWYWQFVNVGESYLWSGVILFLARWFIAGILLIDFSRFCWRHSFAVSGRFLAVAGTLALASLGDFLYAPANYVIIRNYLDPLLIADYGPALQVDALLLLAVAALSSVILPRAVALYDAGDLAALRRAYIAATLVGTLLLAGGAGLVLTFSGQLLRLWLGDVPPGTRAILPFVLIHTVVGGTAGIGRAVMIGMGRLSAYTIATLGGGVLNVSLALLFVVGFGWGLKGIVFATILTVTIRNAVWMPWYILKNLPKNPPALRVWRTGAQRD